MSCVPKVTGSVKIEDERYKIKGEGFWSKDKWLGRKDKIGYIEIILSILFLIAFLYIGYSIFKGLIG